MGTYLIGPIVPPEFLSVKANHGKTQECMTGILSILPCGQNQRNLRTIAELCIRWFTVTTKLYLLKSHLCGQRSGSRASGRCFSDLGRSSLWTTGWNCVLQIPNTPVFFLAGKTLDEWADAQNMLKEFWSRYGKIDQTMVPSNPSQTIPVYLHGDEGRGLGKRPLLVISFQPVMSWVGANSIPSTKHLAIKRFTVTFFSNGLLLPQIPHWVELSCGCLRHAFTTRLVYSVIPSECYAPGGATIDPLLRHLVQDLNQLEQEGLEAEYPKLWLHIYSKPTTSR